MTRGYENQAASVGASRTSWLIPVRQRATDLGASLIGELLPRACPLCEAACGRHATCVHCAKLLEDQKRLRCPLCAMPMSVHTPDARATPMPGKQPTEKARLCASCHRQPPPLAATIALGDYAPPLDRALSTLKFDGQLALASPLGALLMAHLQQAQPALLAQTDALVPIPLAGSRLAERGFNQSLLIARGMRTHAPGQCPPIEAGWLQRQRHTAPQSSLSRAARLTNLIGAFRVPRPERVAGKRIALVDDVMTTGSTLHEAARCLLAAGATEVQALVVARTPA